MVIMDDFDAFVEEKNKRIFELTMQLLEAIAPGTMNPKKDYYYTSAETLKEMAYTAENFLADGGFSTCFPYRDEETGIPCYLSDFRCEHCYYVTPEGHTRLGQGGNNEQLDNQPGN